MQWRMKEACANCPFNKGGEGLALRRSLRAGRWSEILRALRSNTHFLCHKTTNDTGCGSNLICAGAINWQAKRGLSSNLQRIMERLDRIPK